MLDVLQEVRPARIGLEFGVAYIRIELRTRAIQGRNPGVAAAREVQHGKIEWRAEQIVAQRIRDELVDLVANLAGDAAHDGTCRLLGRGAACRIGKGVEEGGDQAELLVR